MTTIRVRRIRKHAFEAQQGYCHYCKLPMWEEDPDKFAAKYQISLDMVTLFQSTAEHLKPRMNGGKDTRQNIVAACRHCNANRHAQNPITAPDPATYAARVREQMAMGLWTR